MQSMELPYWLQGLTLRFREDDEDNNEGDNSDDDGDEGEDEGEEEGGDEGGNADETPEAKIAALEESLRNERKLRRKIERDAKRNARKKTTETGKTEEAEAAQKLKVAEERTERLAAGLLRKEIDIAIETQARKLGFIDPTDALLDDIRREVDADQDPEDPTEIDIDMTSVKDAVADLARRKKHLVGKGTPQERSGGKFRKVGGTDDQLSQDTLATHYPSLR